MPKIEFDNEEGLQVAIDIESVDSAIVFTFMTANGDSYNLSLSSDDSIKFQQFINQMSWKPIETAPDADYPMKMFVVIARDVEHLSTFPYTTDPYCVWKQADGSFARWPHPFPPTHWIPLPEINNDSKINRSSV